MHLKQDCIVADTMHSRKVSSWRNCYDLRDQDTTGNEESRHPPTDASSSTSELADACIGAGAPVVEREHRQDIHHRPWHRSCATQCSCQPSTYLPNDPAGNHRRVFFELVGNARIKRKAPVLRLWVSAARAGGASVGYVVCNGVGRNSSADGPNYLSYIKPVPFWWYVDHVARQQ